MLPKYHLFLTIIFASILLALGWIDVPAALIILFGGFFIDTDHWFIYVVKKKDLSIKRSFKWFYKFHKDKSRPNFLCIFHTVEAYILLIFLSFIWEPFLYLLIGMLFHMSLDLIDAYKKGFYGRKVFLIQALIKKK